MNVLIKIEHLSKKYGKRSALDDISLQLCAGETVGIIGLNGAGKTTLLRCLLGLANFEQGSIEISGIPSTQAKAREALAFLPERASPAGSLTGEDYLNTQWRLYKGRCTGKPDSANLEPILGSLHLSQETLRRPIREYSKGMQQKLGLACILLAERPLWVLDEPMSGLDPLARAEIRTQLQAHQARGGSILFTTHALADIAELCDRLLVIHQGKMRFFGPPQSFIQIHQPLASAEEQRQPQALEAAFLSCVNPIAANVN